MSHEHQPLPIATTGGRLSVKGACRVFLYRRPSSLRAAIIEMRRYFVKEQKGTCQEEGARKLRPRRLTTRELRRKSVNGRLKTEIRGDRLRRFLRSASPEASPYPKRQSNVLQDGKMRQQTALLRHIRYELTKHASRAVNGLDPHTAGIRSFQSGQEPEKRALPRPTLAENRNSFAGRESERCSAKHRCLAVRMAHSFGDEPHRPSRRKARKRRSTRHCQAFSGSTRRR